MSLCIYLSVKLFYLWTGRTTEDKFFIEILARRAISPHLPRLWERAITTNTALIVNCHYNWVTWLKIYHHIFCKTCSAYGVYSPRVLIIIGVKNSAFGLKFRSAAAIDKI